MRTQVRNDGNEACFEYDLKALFMQKKKLKSFRQRR
jgi:hypothetical protein